MEALHRNGYDNFLETGPKSILTGWGKQCLPQEGLGWQASLRPGEDWPQMLTSLNRLYIRGFSVDWSGFDRPYTRERVPLPTYPFERQRFWLEMSRPVRSSVLIAEEAALKDTSLRSTIERLLHIWGGDGAQAINRRVTAPLVFLSSTGQSFFYLNQKGSSMVVQDFVGPPELFDSATQEILEYAKRGDLTLIVLAPEARVDKLRKLGFTTTAAGVWQSIADLNSFSIEAKGMRRLRSKLNSYRNRGSCSTEEYRVGSDPITDRRIVDLMDNWVTRKRRRAPFVSLLKEDILTAKLDPKYRVFLTRRADEIDSVIFLAPIEAKNGYLLDLEFYPVEMPSGCLEFSIVNTIEYLKNEGTSCYSLGSTFGTQLDSDSSEDSRIRDLLQSFHNEGILNEDGIFEFKKKFHPTTVRLYVCCLPETDISLLPEILLMMAAPERITHERDQTSSLAAQPRQGQIEHSADSAAAPGALYHDGSRLPDSHPLLGRRIPLASPDVVFESRLELSSRESSWLADHRILEDAVLPAAAYIEMATAASTSILKSDRVTLEGLSFLQALPLPEQGHRILQLIFNTQEGGGGSFRIWSRRGEFVLNDSDWTLHATGTAKPVLEQSQGESEHRAVSLTEIRSRGLQVMEVESYYHQVGQFGLKYGGSFRAIEELWTGNGEALARIRLPSQLLPEVAKYQIHPVLLDACLQSQGAALLASQSEPGLPMIYLPVGIERINFLRSLDPKLWAYCRLRPVEGHDLEQIVGDIEVFDDSGKLVAELDGLAVRRTSAGVLQQLMRGRPGKALYQVEWRPQRRRQEIRLKTVEEPGKWVIFADSAGIAARLAELLRARGEDCLTVYPNETLETSDPNCWRLNPSEPVHFQRVFEKLNSLWRVVFLWSAEPAAPEELDLASLRRAQLSGCQGLLHLLQSLVTVERTGSPQLWVVTRGVQSIGNSYRAVNPVQSLIWGLGRTAAQEHPEIWGGMIDLESHASIISDAELLLQEIWDPEEEDHLAFREAQRYIARLVGKESWKAAPTLRLRRDATYIITGGLGGLGLTVARWMVARGARHLLLVGRRAVSKKVQKVLAELEQAGAREAAYFQADVSEESEVARLLAQIDQNLLPLRGIVHAAGVLADGTVLQQSWLRFLQVMAAKVDGSWHLHNLTKNLTLDHFVLFSSSASILGAAGQGNYAAANAFMDGLAHFRQAQGLPALSINWGPWDEVGMSALMDPRAKTQRAAQGIRPLSPTEGIRLLEQAMSEPWTQVGIISVDWEKLLKAASPVLRRSSLFKDLVVASAGARAETGADPSRIIMEFLGADPDERRRVLQSYVVERVANVLRSEPANVSPEEPLTSQGFDSLMALELRERVESELQISIPILSFFRSNNVTALTAFLLEELAKKYRDARSEPAQGESPRELLARLTELSDVEVDSALRLELER
jgi:acyl transferase domain-containing protein/acyl carrier protein